MAIVTQRFNLAPLDARGRVVTVLILVLLLAGPVVVSRWTGEPPLPPVGLGITVVGILWSLAPARYELDGCTLRVVRRLGRPFVAQVEGLGTHADPHRLGMRVAASGGGFGWFGRFRRRDIGTYRAYMTSRQASSALALRTDRGIVVLSPAVREAMTTVLREAHR